MKGSETYLLCKSELPNGRCSFIYKKGAYEDDTCPICGTYAATDIYKEQRLDNTLNENGLHKVFFDRVPRVYDEMNLSIWQTLAPGLGKRAAEEQAFLILPRLSRGNRCSY